MITEHTENTKRYLKADRAAGNCYPGSNREAFWDRRSAAIWETLTPEEREFVNKTWRDPR